MKIVPCQPPSPGTLGQALAQRQCVAVVHADHDRVGVLFDRGADDPFDCRIGPEEHHLGAGRRQHSGQRVANEVVHLEDGQDDTHSVEPRSAGA